MWHMQCLPLSKSLLRVFLGSARGQESAWPENIPIHVASTNGTLYIVTTLVGTESIVSDQSPYR